MRVAFIVVPAGLGLALVLTATTPAFAQRASCDQVAEARASGRSTQEIKDELRTTTARIEACDHAAELKAKHDARREETMARRESRREPADH